MKNPSLGSENLCYNWVPVPIKSTTATNLRSAILVLNSLTGVKERSLGYWRRTDRRMEGVHN
jgi:hypothetical protein